MRILLLLLLTTLTGWSASFTGTHIGNGAWLTNVPTIGRTFYVATNGNNATAVVNEPTKPFSGMWRTNASDGGVLSRATNRGDIIKVLAGTYTISNLTPVIMAEGTIMEGVGMPVFTVSTNIVSAGDQINYSTFQPGNNCIVRGICWEATNHWYTHPEAQQVFASFAMSGRPFTNVVVEFCDLQGGSDIFFSTNAASDVFDLTVQNCKLTMAWDVCSLNCSGLLRSIANEWYGSTDVNRVTRFNVASCSFADYGSRFIGFAGMDSAHGFQGNAGMSFHGSRFEFLPLEEGFIYSESGRFDSMFAGSYINTANGKTYSLDPERASYVTNGFTTNIVYAFNLTNLYVTLGDPDTDLNGIYVLKTTDGNFSSGISTWTNTSRTNYVLTLNDAEAVGIEGNPPAGSVRDNGGPLIALGGFGIVGLTEAGQNVFVFGDGDSTCTVTMGTNSITTNGVANLQPSIFYQQLVWSSNTTENAELKLLTGRFRSVGGVSSLKSNLVASTSITVGASAFNWTNIYPFNVNVFIGGATTAAVAVNGTTVFGALAVGTATIPLQPGERVTLTYTGSPTMLFKPF